MHFPELPQPSPRDHVHAEFLRIGTRITPGIVFRKSRKHNGELAAGLALKTLSTQERPAWPQNGRHQGDIAPFDVLGFEMLQVPLFLSRAGAADASPNSGGITKLHASRL